jgi:flagellar M-ring protein FliF
MDTLSKSNSRGIARSFNSALTWLAAQTPVARLVAALAIAVVVAVGGWSLFRQVSLGNASLLEGHPFTSDELEAAQAAFGAAGLNDFEIDGSRILVPRTQKAKYLAALADGEAMPANFGTLLADATTKSGPFASRSQIDAINKVALERTLANTIRWMKGIKSAAVIYHLPKKTGFRWEGQATAMVTVAPHGEQPLDESQVPKIRDLVAAAIGIDAGAVTVVDVNGRSYAGGRTDRIGPSAFDDPYFSRKRSYEANYEQKIQKALSYVPGATVTAHVELDPQMRRHEETSGNSQERTVTEFAALTPKKVTISVGVPDSYYEEIWRKMTARTNGPAGATPDKKAFEKIELAEKTKIQNFVAQAIPQNEMAANVQPLVSVTTFTQLAAAQHSPSTANRALEWLNTHGLGLATFGLIVAGLFAFRSIIRARFTRGTTQTSSPVANQPATTVLPNETAQHRSRRSGGRSLRDELVKMVRNDPDAAANVLKGWIG